MERRFRFLGPFVLFLLVCVSTCPARASTAPPDAPAGVAGSRAHEVRFRFVAPEGIKVRMVSLRGSFNGWGETPLSLQDDGSWSVTLELEPGEYQYKFFIDGQWPRDMERGPGGAPLDPEADRYVDDGHDGQNAVRVVAGGARSARPREPAELDERMNAMTKAIADASIAVYPIIVGGQTSPKVAELVALLLERSNIRDIRVMEKEFNVSARSDIWSNAEVFGALVRSSSIEADYALLGEYRGDPRGAVEVRCIVVDRQGRPVWVDSQALAKGRFDPMDCTVLMVDRLRTRLGLPDPGEDAPQGRWAEHWRTESGLPQDRELAGMKDRCRGLRVGFAKAKVWVFPILRGDTLDREGAATLATFLEQGGICLAKPAPVDVRIEYKPSPNEQKKLWDLARGVRNRVREIRVDADYALYAEYFQDSRASRAHAVHFVLCDAAGEWVIVDFQNDHHPDFQRIAPTSAADCSRLVTSRIKHYLSAEE